MMGGPHIIWRDLSFLESSCHGVENRIRQYTSLVNQRSIDGIVNHILKLARIGIKGDLPWCRQCIFLDHFAAPVYAERPQALLLELFHGLGNSLLLLILEVGLRHGDDVLLIEVRDRHVDLDLESCPTGRAKRCVDAKLIFKHKGLIPDSIVKACQPI